MSEGRAERARRPATGRFRVVVAGRGRLDQPLRARRRPGGRAGRARRGGRPPARGAGTPGSHLGGGARAPRSSSRCSCGRVGPSTSCTSAPRRSRSRWPTPSPTSPGSRPSSSGRTTCSPTAASSRGVLAEADLGAAGAVRAVVVGIGINVSARGGAAGSRRRPRPRARPSPEVGRPPTACSTRSCCHLDERLDAARRRCCSPTTGRGSPRSAPRCGSTGPTGPSRASRLDVDELGGLVVATDEGETVTVTAGDVVHLRPA